MSEGRLKSKLARWKETRKKYKQYSRESKASKHTSKAVQDRDSHKQQYKQPSKQNSTRSQREHEQTKAKEKERKPTFTCSRTKDGELERNFSVLKVAHTSCCEVRG